MLVLYRSTAWTRTDSSMIILISTSGEHEPCKGLQRPARNVPELWTIPLTGQSDMPKTTSVPTTSNNLPTHHELGDAKGQVPEALAAFLPHKSDPDYVWMLTELIRMDLEQQWAKGNRIGLDAYRAVYPEIFTDDAITRSLVVEEYRLRERFGEEPSAVEYSEDYGGGMICISCVVTHTNTSTR